MEPQLTFSGLNWAKKHKRSFDTIVTLYDPGSNHRLVYHQRPAHVMHQSYAFDDVEFFAPGLTPVTQVQADSLWAFAHERAQQGSTLVHCFHGVGRSAALTMALLTDRLGCATKAATSLMDHRHQPDPDVAPNLMLLYRLDTSMGGNTGMVDAALATFGQQRYLYRADCMLRNFVFTGSELETYKANKAAYARPFGPTPPHIDPTTMTWSFPPV